MEDRRNDAVIWLYGQLCKHSRLESNRLSIKEKKFDRIFEKAKSMVRDDAGTWPSARAPQAPDADGPKRVEDLALESFKRADDGYVSYTDYVAGFVAGYEAAMGPRPVTPGAPVGDQ